MNTNIPSFPMAYVERTLKQMLVCSRRLFRWQTTKQTSNLFSEDTDILLLSGLVGAVNFKGNPNDEKILEKNERMTGAIAKNAYVDRGYRRKWIGETKINAPDNGSGKSPYEKAKARRCFRRRAAIEPIIGHAKENYGMRRNYLKGEVGDAINAMLAASAFNFKSWMRKATAEAIFVLIYIKTKWQEITIQSKLIQSF